MLFINWQFNTVLYTEPNKSDFLIEIFDNYATLLELY